MQKIRYAAYGSNLHPDRLRRRIPSAELIGTAFVADHSLLFHKLSVDGSGKCNILAPGDGVHVAVYEFDAAAKAVLDRIEGLGSGYTETALDLDGFGECYTYEAASTHIADNLLPYDWYRELVLLGCLALGFPAAYVEKIRTITAEPDPDPERARVNRDLIRSLRRTA